eukprot:m.247160 g.247160  ORF g.247160 m.247160 type:complete len:224 (+) comp15310_c0_seq1:3-674(+)
MSRGMVLVAVLSALLALAAAETCELCVNSADCCTTALSGGAGSCAGNLSHTIYTLSHVVGRPLWVSFQTPEGGDVSVSLQSTEAGTWFQSVAAHAFYPFVDDALFFADPSRPSLCFRRWGCMQCNGSPEQTYCSTDGWANASVVGAAASCYGLPQVTVYWWGEGVGHGQGSLTICLGLLPAQPQPQPPMPATNSSLGASWAVALGHGNSDGLLKQTVARVVCK